MNDEEFADVIRNADDKTIWEAFGRELQDAAHGTDADFAGFTFVYNPDHYEYMVEELNTDADLSKCFGIGNRITGGSRESVSSTPIAKQADAFAVFRASRSRVVVDTVRRRVADAIDSDY